MPICKVTVRNASSPVPVRSVSATFAFSDGSSSVKSSGGINLKQGQSANLSTSGADKAKCVKRVNATITVGSRAITKSDGATLCQSELVWRVDATGVRSFKTELPKSEWPQVMDTLEIVTEHQSEAAPNSD